MTTIIAFFVSTIRYIVVTDTGTYTRKVKISFPDDEDYDGIELIDDDALAHVKELMTLADELFAEMEKMGREWESRGIEGL